MDGREVELLDSLIPGLYAKATGRALAGEVDQPPKIDPAAVDRLLKVLELRLKYRDAGKGAKAQAPPAWAPSAGSANGG